jgi:8-oxo-dGTP pyrophosphatase MutT (NUDIX family)
MYITIHEPTGPHICHSDTEFQLFSTGLTVVQAAGGLVLNDDGHLLMIFRKGCWDLPKGKVDEGETLEVCAVREVQEETGITRLLLKEKLQTTYHTYLLGSEKIIKPSHWFLMYCHGNEKLVPQVEEAITEIAWMDKASVANILDNTYASIRELLKNHFL